MWLAVQSPGIWAGPTELSTPSPVAELSQLSGLVPSGTQLMSPEDHGIYFPSLHGK